MKVAIGRFWADLSNLFPSNRDIKIFTGPWKGACGRFGKNFENLFPFSEICTPAFAKKREQISEFSLKTPKMPSRKEKNGENSGYEREQILKKMRKAPTAVAGIRRAGLRLLTQAQTIAAFAAYKNKKNRALASKLAGHGSFSAPTRKTSLRSVSSCHGSRRDTDSKKKGMALSKLSHAFLFVVVVAARC